MFKQNKSIYTSFPTHTDIDALFTVHLNNQNLLRIRKIYMFVCMKDLATGSKKNKILSEE